MNQQGVMTTMQPQNQQQGFPQHQPAAFPVTQFQQPAPPYNQFEQLQPPNTPDPQPQIVQTLDLKGARWKDMRSDMVGAVVELAQKLGFTCEPNEKLLEMGFPLEDEFRYEDGDVDMEFEETAVESLGRIQLIFTKGAWLAHRFRHNLAMRNHEPDMAEQPEELTQDQTQVPQQ